MDFVELWRIYWPSWTPTTIAVGIVFGCLLGFCFLFRTIDGKMKPFQFVCAMMLFTWLYWVFASTVFCRTEYSEYHYSLKLFWSYEFMRAYPNSYMLQEIVLNILMLLPVGVLFPVAFDCRKLWVTTLFGFLCTTGIELLQLITKRGLFEWDDMFHNTLGVIVGYLLVTSAMKMSEYGQFTDKEKSGKNSGLKLHKKDDRAA
ncbi:MAG: VanZ family protein [Lachnospiraceae bacterium]|nr:VanZ family protein [Lachnospiraceae bacterium]